MTESNDLAGQYPTFLLEKPYPVAVGRDLPLNRRDTRGGEP